MVKSHTAFRTLHYYWQATKEHKAMAATTFITTPVLVILRDVVAPYLIAEFLGLLTGNPTWEYIGHSILPLAIWYIIIQVCVEIIMVVRVQIEWSMAIYVMYSLANLSFDTIAAQSMQFHNDNFSGSMVSAANKFVSAYERLMDTLTFTAVPFATMVTSSLVVLFIKAPTYAAGLLALIVLYVAVAYYFFKKMAPLNKKHASAENRQTGQLADSITNINSVKSYASERLERTRYAEYSRKTARAYLDLSHFSTKRNILFSLIYIGISCVLALFALSGQRTFGIDYAMLYLIVSYTTTIGAKLWDVNNIFRDMSRIFGDAHEMTEILDLPDDVVDLPDATELKVTEAAVDFEDITFKHAEAKSPIFSDFTLNVAPGERVGLVGVSGSGKTTLTKLLLRYADVDAGKIIIDGQDIKHVTQHSLRRAIAYVPQETDLFHRPISDNIAYGRPGATKEEIIRAAKLANAHDFIMELPDGYDTLVGERGIKLSGGQRQRIAIARAILKDAPILVLDEATSALDSESEAAIQEALGELMRGRTSIVIAHRLSTVASLDRIVVLKNGKIIETGTHADLLRQDGAYAGLWSRQSGAFVRNDSKTRLDYEV